MIGNRRDFSRVPVLLGAESSPLKQWCRSLVRLRMQGKRIPRGSGPEFRSNGNAASVVQAIHTKVSLSACNGRHALPDACSLAADSRDRAKSDQMPLTTNFSR